MSEWDIIRESFEVVGVIVLIISLVIHEEEEK